MNMIADMNEAWKDMNEQTSQKNQEYVLNLISHAFVDLDSAWRDVAKRRGERYEDEAFYVFQKILVNFMLCDNEFLQSEYDCYCKFCHLAHVQPLSVEDCRSFYNRVSVEDLGSNIRGLFNLRSNIGEDKYHAMVRGFCHFCLLSDHEMDENEYYILSCFYASSEAPSSWAQFKKEWA